VLKQFVEESRKELDVPGVAVGLIDHGKVVFAGGFGVRELGKADAVDADTLFMIASNTKALTTLMLARMVDQKRFGWTRR
jgi:CubicO group peptidase (beta-lactamase class C family)